MVEDQRTLEDFVEDLVSEGRTPDEIRTVARNTRWRDRANKAGRMAARIIRRFSKKT